MFGQHPIISIIFSVLSILIILRECIVKHRFIKVKTLLSFFLTFICFLILVFYKQISDNSIYQIVSNWVLFGVDVCIAVLIFTSIDLSFSSEAFNQELTRSLNETKLYVVLDKKDRIKGISSLFLKHLGVQLSDVYGKNFFEVVEIKYRIISLNGENFTKDELKKYYQKKQRINENKVLPFELGIQTDDANEDYFNFTESLIFSSNKYKGRVLLGELKSEENLMGVEKNLNKANEELELLKSRFVTILEKTKEGIYFTNLNDGYIWVNDNLVENLKLNGNSISLNDFYSNIHPEDIAFYEEKMKNLQSNDYEISYRFNIGTNYIYVKEIGRKVVLGKTVELCGIMVPLNNYSFAKTETSLDNLKGEPEMLACLNRLENEDRIFETIYFRIDDIPAINEEFGRPIGNMIMSQYVDFISQKFVTNNQIFRVSGLEFVAFITDYRKMEILKNNVVSGEKLLHVSSNYASKKIDVNIYMGITKSDDTPSHKDNLKHAKEALKICSNPNYNFNYAFYKEIR